MEKQIILFDGVCNLCNNSVNFIIDHDPNRNFVFATIQEKTGHELKLRYGLEPGVLDSVVLIKEEKVYKKSSAALEIARSLSGFWKFLYIFKLVPVILRDFVYDLIVKNRYRWFGKTDHCRIPTPDLKNRFI